jgi:hypothetical protein
MVSAEPTVRDIRVEHQSNLSNASLNPDVILSFNADVELARLLASMVAAYSIYRGLESSAALPNEIILSLSEQFSSQTKHLETQWETLEDEALIDMRLEAVPVEVQPVRLRLRYAGEGEPILQKAEVDILND